MQFVEENFGKCCSMPGVRRHLRGKIALFAPYHFVTKCVEVSPYGIDLKSGGSVFISWSGILGNAVEEVEGVKDIGRTTSA